MNLGGVDAIIAKHQGLFHLHVMSSFWCNLHLSKRLCGSHAVCALLHVGTSGGKFQISITCYVHVAEVKSHF